MRRGGRRRIPPRRRIFLGCEGESEQAYGLRLQQLVDEQHRTIYIDTVLLQPGGGDPLALVECAVDKSGQRSRQRGAYRERAVLLDRDRLGQVPERDTLLFALAAKHRLRLIWQDTCHEALLLRHLKDCHGLRPQSSKIAFAELQRRWPDYQKNASASVLASRIDRAAVLRAAAVEDGLRAFLDLIVFGRT